MLEKLSITRMASALAEQSANRMQLIARNVAQANTPGYKAMDLPSFSQVYEQSADGGMRATRPGHFTSVDAVVTPIPQATRGAASPDGNTVSVEQEMVKSVMARQDHEMAMAVYSATREITRASLGRK